MTTALIILITIVALPLLYLASLNGDFSVRRSLEVYENDPASVNHSNEIITSIYISIR
jgi:hypothetical protein